VIELPGFIIRYPGTLPRTKIDFLKCIVPTVYDRVTEIFGYSPSDTTDIFCLMTGGGGWTCGKTIGVGALGNHVETVSILIHEGRRE
jgi:hypothetical protein